MRIVWLKDCMGNWYMSQTILMMHQTQEKNTWNQIDGWDS